MFEPYSLSFTPKAESDLITSLLRLRIALAKSTKFSPEFGEKFSPEIGERLFRKIGYSKDFNYKRD